MFLFNLLHQGTLASRSRKVFALAVMFCLSTALLFTGCKTEEDGFKDDHKLNSKIIGKWTSSYDDYYDISSDKLVYDDGWGGGYAGTVEYVSNFSETAGVIIIKYEADHEPVYYDDYDNYGDPAHIVALKGNFIGIYYKDFKPGVSVSIAVAYVDGGAEEKTLDDAKKAFTMGNEGKYIGRYGTYSK
jgi:hypothetical protein